MSRPVSMVALVEAYLDTRHRLGFALRSQGAELRLFARYAERIGHQGPITTALAVQWARLPKEANSIYWATRLDIVRRFARYRAAFDSNTEVPPERLLGSAYRRPTPHIYSEHEVQALLEAAAQLKPPEGLCPHTYATLFGLLLCTGLRISEALRLTRDAVDLNNGILTVRETKYKKSRMVPLHRSAIEALRRYSEQRDRHFLLRRSEAFFLAKHDTPLNYRQVLRTFTSLRERLGWGRTAHGRAPRIHDMRHSFTVRRVLRWYQEGVDVDRKMAALSTYLGHVSVSDTYWYLSAVPELLAVTAERFERFAQGDNGGTP
jgi:integrase